MEFLSSTWWIWLILAIICWAYMIFNQIARMKKVMGSDFDDDSLSGFFKGLVQMALVALAGTVFFILFLIGLAAYLIKSFF